MLLVLTFCLGATIANAAVSKPPVIVSQVKLLADITSGGFTAGGTPAGGSFAVTPQGNIALGTTYGGVVNVFDGTTGAVTSFGEGGPAGLVSDTQGNLYQGTQYDTKVYKFPYLNGTYPTAKTYNNCTGNDTERCVVASLSGSMKFRAFVFDAAGNLFAVTDSDGTNGGNAIYVVAAADLYSPNTAKLVYTDDSTHVIGSIALDPSGNLFFTDVVYADQANGKASSSYLNVLPYSASTGYGAKTVLVTYTNPAPLANYNNVLGGVNIDPGTGTVYYSDTNTGVFAFPNTPANFADVAHAYLVATKGNYQIAPDGHGNLWAVAYDNAAGKAAVYHILLSNVLVPTSAVGAPSQATDVTTALNGVDCAGSVAFARSGGNTTTASAATTGTCASISFAGVSAASFATTVSVTPATAGTTVATMKATDSANNVANFTITGGQLIGHQSVVVGQVSNLGDLTAGTFNAQKMPSGGSFAVTPNGFVVVGTSWGNDVDVFDLASGAVTKFTLGNNAGMNSDSQSNLYGNALYSHTFYKFPYTGAGWATDTTNAPDCTGNDTKACKMPNVGQATWDYDNNLDFKNSAFDSLGNLFLVTATDNVNGGNSIYVLTADKLYTGKPALVFTDDATHVVASIAIDPWGTLFFTDATYTDQGSGTIATSALNVLPYSPITGFAAAKTVLATTTNSPAVKNGITGVGVDANGTVYYSDNNGVFAFPNNPVTPFNIANAYLVSGTGGYQVMLDKGNVYSVAADGSNQGVYRVALNNVTVPDTTVGVASEATNVVTALSGDDCSGSVTFTASSENTSTASAFTNGTCATRSLGDVPVIGGAYPTTVSLSPSAAGKNFATLIGNNTAPFTVTGFAAAGTAQQTITFDNPGNQYAGKTLVLIATTSATGLNVTLTSTTPSVCTLSGSTATFVTGGTCTIEATQPGDNTYAAAPKVTQSFTVDFQPQTITFATPETQKQGTTASLSATSDSGLTVAFASTTPAVCTVSGTTASFIAGGTCTIEATQAGNSIFAAAPTVSVSFTVNGPVATPTFSPAAGTYTSAQTVTIASTTPGAVIYYTTDGSTPTASSTAYTQPIKVAVTTTVKAIAIATNYPDSAVASGTFTITQDFTFAASSSSIAVPSNGSGTATLTVDRVGGFNEAIWFACSGLPAGYACSFSPNAIMPLEAGATTTTATTTLTITKTASVFASLRHSNSFLATMTLSMGVCFFGFGTRRRRLQVLIVLALTVGAIAMFVGCGGNSSTPTTQPVNANVVVTARAGAVSHTVTVNVTSAK